MDKQEFMKEISHITSPDMNIREVTETEFELINKVYTWHPTISNIHGKQQVAWLYAQLGITVFRELYDVAEQMELLDAERTRIEKLYNRQIKSIEIHENMIKQITDGEIKARLNKTKNKHIENRERFYNDNPLDEWILP